MSVLDTFYLMFSSNADELKKGAADAEQATKKLEESVSKSGDKGEESAHKVTKAHSELGKAVDEVKEKFASYGERAIETSLEIAAAFAAIFAAEKLVENFFETAEMTDELNKTAKSLGVNVEELDAWGQVVQRSGGTAAGFADSLKGLNSNLERIAVTGHSRALPFFQQLGIQVKDSGGKVKSAFELLPELAAKFQGMPPAKSGAFGRAIGLDEGTIRTLQAGSKELDELLERQKRFGNVTKESAETAEKFNDEWSDIKQLFRNVMIAVDDGLMPILYDLAVILEDMMVFLREHKDFAVGVFIALAAGVLYAAEAFGLLSAATYTAILPYIAIAVAIAALVALFGFLYDDVMNFAEGNNSLIGTMAERWPIVGQVVKAVVAVFGEMWDFCKELFSDLLHRIKGIPEGFKQWGAIFTWIGQQFDVFIEYLKGLFDELPGPVKAAFNDVVAVIKSVMQTMGAVGEAGWEVIKAVFKAGVKGIGAIFSLIGDLITNPQQAFQNFGNAIKKIIADLVGDMPNIKNAFEAVGTAFAAIGATIMKLWADIKAAIVGTIGAVSDAAASVGGGLSKAWNVVRHPITSMTGGGDAPAAAKQGADGASGTSGQPGASGAPGALPSQALAGVSAGQSTLNNVAASGPLMSQTSSSLDMSSRSAATNVTVQGGPVTINAQNANAAEVKEAFDKHQQAMLSDYVNTHLADGMAY